METESEVLLLTVDEARRALGGVGRTTLWRLARDGEIVQVSIGSRAFITTKSVEAYVDRLSETASQSIGGAA